MESDTLKRDIVRQLDRLPREALREVRDVVGYLQSKRERKTPAEGNAGPSDPLREMIGTLDTEPFADAADDELYGA